MESLSELKDQHLFIRIFEQAPIGMAIYWNGGSHRVNSSLCKMLGYSERELMEFTVEAVSHPDDIEVDLKLWNQLNSGEIESYQIEKRYIHKSGDIKWGLLHVTVERGLPGINSDLFISQIVDITEQKKKEEELKKIKELHQIISEHSQDIIMRVTPDGIISYVSPALYNQLGYEPDELIGKYCYDYWHPEDLDYWLKHGKPDERMVLYRVRHKDGHYVWQETHAKKIRNPEGAVQHVIAIGRDITERIETEEFIRRSEKLSVVGELAAGIAHEIRNPLTSLRGFVQMYMEEDRDGSKNLRNEVMIQEIDRINEIVSELLVLSKPSTESYGMRNIEEKINQVVTLFEGQANLHNVQIITEIDPNLPLIYGLRSLKQVFINVLKNAIESMPNGGSVRIRAKHLDNTISIRVEDTGCGIPQEKMALVGNPFFTTKETGTGLGLMVSQRVIQNHKGTVRIESEVGKGTIVEIDLPVRSQRMSG